MKIATIKILWTVAIGSQIILICIGLFIWQAMPEKEKPGRDLTPEENARVDELEREIEAYNQKLKRQIDAQRRLNEILGKGVR